MGIQAKGSKIDSLSKFFYNCLYIFSSFLFSLCHMAWWSTKNSKGQLCNNGL